MTKTKPKSKSKPAPEPGDPVLAASLVARVVELDDVRLRSVAASAAAHPRELVKQDLILENLLQRQAYSYDEAKNLLTVELTLTVAMRPDRKGRKARARPEGPALAIEATYSLDYSLTAPPPPPAERARFFGAFAEVNATFNAWPFLRELVQSVTARMGLPPLTLPVYRVPRPGPKPVAGR